MENEIEFRVEWGETDPAEITFYPNILKWYDWGTWNLLAALGLTLEVLRGDYGLIGCPIVEVNSKFHSPTRFWDWVRLTSHLHSWGRNTFRVGHAVRVGDRLCAEGLETRVWARKSKDRPGGIEAVLAPEAIRQKLRATECRDPS